MTRQGGRNTVSLQSARPSMTFQFAFLAAAVFPALVVFAGVRDAATMTIPNRLNIAAAAAFFPVALVCGLPWPALGLAVALGAAALAVGMLMFALNWIGGGDAKLFAACGLWLGGAATVPFLMWTALAGGALALGLLLARRMVQHMPVAGPPGCGACSPRARACPTAWRSRRGRSWPSRRAR